jgi:beta-phosphoglucomutase
MYNSKKAVIFDLDGVLVDTGKFHKQAWYDLAANEGFKMAEEIFNNTFGMQNYQIIPMLAGNNLSPDEVERMSSWKEQRYRDLISGHVRLLVGAEQLLEDLKSNGFSLAIGTSAPMENLSLILNNTPLNGYFDAYVTSEDVSSGKPAPDTFLKAAEKLAVLSNDCVVVEDAVAGVQAARAAGMKVVAVTNTKKRCELLAADIVVDSLSELSAADFVKLKEV